MSMNLQEFIRSALVDILSGIDGAKSTEGFKQRIAPDWVGPHNYPDKMGVSSSTSKTSTVVQFDVAVTTSASEASSAGAKGKF